MGVGAVCIREDDIASLERLAIRLTAEGRTEDSLLLKRIGAAVRSAFDIPEASPEKTLASALKKAQARKSIQRNIRGRANLSIGLSARKAR